MMEPRFRIVAFYARQRAVCRRAFSFSVIALLGLTAPVGQAPALAQDVRSLSETVARLERQLQTLERNIYRSGSTPAAASSLASGAAGDAAPSPAGVAQLNVRVGEIGEQLRQVTGEVEKVGFNVRQLAARLDKLVTDYDFRLRSLEKNGTAASMPQADPPAGEGSQPAAGAPAPGTLGTLTESQMRAAGVEPTVPTAAPQSGPVAVASPDVQTASAGNAVALPAGDASSQYEYAFSFLMRRDFPGAEQAFSQFVSSHPGDPLAGNAQYWLGETYYVRNDFTSAARTFAEGFQRYPNSSKAADNLLKLGLSLAALNRKQDACITFAKLSTSYPGAPSNILQRAKGERGKLGCG